MRYMSLMIFTLVALVVTPAYGSKDYNKKLIGHTNGMSKEDKNIYTSIIKIKGSYRHITPKYVKRLIKESHEVISMQGNTWITSAELLGIVMGESDLRWWIITGRRGMWDCGIGQNHTPLFSKTYSGRWNLCKKLTKSTKLSLIYTMKELNIIRSRWCIHRYNKYKKKYPNTWKYMQYRCIFNIYNQGPRFLTRKNCWVRYKYKGYSKKEYRRKLNRCLYINRYWLRTSCFIRGMELGAAPKKSCRGALSLKWINKVYGVKQ